MNVLAIDTGGTHVKILAPERRLIVRFPPDLTSCPPADITFERIGDLLNYDLPTLLEAALTDARSKPVRQIARSS